MEKELIKKRIIGYDIARSVAIFGMVIVNFKLVMGAEKNGPTWLVDLVSLLSGRAAAVFVVLAGIGISLLSQKARISGDNVLLRQKRRMLFKRAFFLFAVGLLYTPIWPADILHFYGIYIAVAAMLLMTPSSRLLAFCGLLLLLFTLMFFSLNYSQGWNWETLNYNGFWSFSGMLRHLFFNGFHPVVPWLLFLLLGMVIGRLDMEVLKVRRRVFALGAGIAIVSEGLSRILIYSLSTPTSAEDILAVFGTGPMPPLPLYMLAGAGTATAFIAASVSFGQKYEEKRWLIPFVRTGQLALTLYVAHVFVGMGILEAMGRLKNQALATSLLASAVFCAGSIIFAHIWRSRFKQGPLEAIMRALTKEKRSDEK